MRVLIWFFCFFSIFTLESIEPSEKDFLLLKGNLGIEELQPLLKKVQEFEAHPPKEIGIAIHSTSGNLGGVLDFAQRLFALKLNHDTKVTVYIEEQALGPSAVIPFLADSIKGSLFFAWGDIPSGADNPLPTNLLQNRVIGLIAPQIPHRELLRLLAIAMTDPKVTIIDDNGWKIANEKSDSKLRISVEGQTLVVNQNQLKDLGLLAGITSLTAFEGHYHQEIQPAVSAEISPTKLEGNLKAHIHFSPEGPNRVGRINVNDRSDQISQATWIYIKNALDYYKKHPPSFIILTLNTPGGEVFAAEKISDALKEMDTQFNVPIVAYIDNWAMSAGAMLAYSCRFIAVAKDGSMGAAEPVTQEASGEMKSASEKVNSALRADFASRASFFGRNPNIAEAMVDKDIILVMRHGKIIKLNSETEIRNMGPEPDLLISPKGKLLTLNASQLIEYGVADLEIKPEKLEPITAQEKEKGEWPAKKEPLFQNAFFASIPNATVEQYQMDWKTQFFVLLANPVVSSGLFLVMMLAFYMELNSPGFGLAATVALTCLFLIVLSSFSQEIGDWLELILLLTGLGVIILDLFFLPTFGLLGVIGVILFFVGLIGLMLPGLGSISFEFDTKTFNAAGVAFFNRLVWFLGTLIVGLACIAVLARFVVPSFSTFKKFVLQGQEQEGYIAGIDHKLLPPLGSKGLVMSTLRPAGKVEVEGKLYDAMSTGRFIEKGAAVNVVRYEGSTLFVEEVKTV